MKTATRIKRFPGVFYSDESSESEEFQQMLDSLDANYETNNARSVGLLKSLYIVDGSSLSCQVLRDELARFGR